MEPVVTTTSGRVRGTVHEGASAFLGIPYAAPPFGERRFAAPAPPERWDGVRPAVEFGPTCPQPDRQATIIPEPVIPGDDCLNLNVFTPDTGSGGLPVLVWIHGGGFTAGCNNSPWYRGEPFARDGVVVVSINYRLGAEGFLVVPGAPTNRGVLDWLAALRWVQDNIDRFGGDPAKVTIAGQSAGGVACATLLTSPPARGLFRAAICMSGSWLPAWSAADARALTDAVAPAAGVPADRDGLSSVHPDRLVATQDGAAAAVARSHGQVRLPFGPVVDGDVVLGRDGLEPGPRSPAILAGATAEEFNLTTGSVPGGIDEERMVRRLHRLGLDDDGVAAYRRALPEASPAWIVGQAVTDSWFKAPALQLADRWSTGGGHAWLYAFEWRPPTSFGCVHCLDVPFAFGHLDATGVAEVAGPEPPAPLGDAVHDSWVRFVTDGQPGWASHHPDRPVAMVWDTPSRLTDEPWPVVRETWLSGVRRP